MVEFGQPKDDQGKEIFNYSIAYDRNNREPLFCEAYPGSIVDISQLQFTLEKAKGYGYRKAGFILDRGYFSKDNIRFMDENGYDFVIMVKGMKKLVRELVLQKRGTFEDNRKNSIRAYKVSDTTVKHKLYTCHCYVGEDDSRGSAGAVQKQGWIGKTFRGRQILPWGKKRTGLLKRINGYKDFHRVCCYDHPEQDLYDLEG